VDTAILHKKRCRKRHAAYQRLVETRQRLGWHRLVGVEDHQHIAARGLHEDTSTFSLFIVTASRSW